MTTTNRLHTVFGAFFIIGFPVAVTIIGWHVTDLLLAPLKNWMPWLTIAVWVGFLTFLGSIVYFGRKGDSGSERVKIGWPNRFMMVIYISWLIIIASKIR